ncbi:hypothetical protein P607_10005 [Comamonas thiooxydans]|nr:hypothetical protein P609_22205 [Comamonas thiooxydans]KGH20285.1 hypothetical protein P607_10005 [Comamonas thiooxydans]KGH23710.1 hypothetical protein P606_11385 [Comamonas thiooxydans]
MGMALAAALTSARLLSSLRARSAAWAMSLRSALVALRFLKLGSFFHIFDKEMTEIEKGACRPLLVGIQI